jgi:hypothetical protein
MLGTRRRRNVPTMAAIVDLNGHAGYLHWHFISLSVPNLIVILVMLIVFVAAIMLPFPGHTDRSSERP